MLWRLTAGIIAMVAATALALAEQPSGRTPGVKVTVTSHGFGFELPRGFEKHPIRGRGGREGPIGCYVAAEGKAAETRIDITALRSPLRKGEAPVPPSVTRHSWEELTVPWHGSDIVVLWKKVGKVPGEGTILGTILGLCVGVWLVAWLARRIPNTSHPR